MNRISRFINIALEAINLVDGNVGLMGVIKSASLKVNVGSSTRWSFWRVDFALVSSLAPVRVVSSVLPLPLQSGF